MFFLKKYEELFLLVPAALVLIIPNADNEDFLVPKQIKIKTTQPQRSYYNHECSF